MHYKLRQGFTLIELIVVMAILGILMTIVIVAINPVEQIRTANDTKVQQDIEDMGKAVETYAANHNGNYPATLNDLLINKDLSVLPTPLAGYTTNYADPNAILGIGTTTPCTAGVTCSQFIIYAQMQAAKNGSKYFVYDSKFGRAALCPTNTSGC